MRRLQTVVAALFFAPFLASAQVPAPPALEATRPAAEWSFGGGVSYGLFTSSVSSLSPPFPGVSGLANAGVQVATASLERRLSNRTWLVLGAAGSATRRRGDVPVDAYGYSRDDSRSLYFTGGVRRVLNDAGAPVVVSVLILAEAGFGAAEQRYTNTASQTRQDVTSLLAGGNAGIAFDRELTGGLSLRVASPLLGVGYARDRIALAGQPERTASRFSGSALLAPRLELRLAF